MSTSGMEGMGDGVVNQKQDVVEIESSKKSSSSIFGLSDEHSYPTTIGIDATGSVKNDDDDKKFVPNHISDVSVLSANYVKQPLKFIDSQSPADQEYLQMMVKLSTYCASAFS